MKTCRFLELFVCFAYCPLCDELGDCILYISYPLFGSLRCHWMLSTFSSLKRVNLSVGNPATLYFEVGMHTITSIIFLIFILFFLHAPKNSGGGGDSIIFQFFYIKIDEKCLLQEKVCEIGHLNSKGFLGMKLWLR